MFIRLFLLPLHYHKAVLGRAHDSLERSAAMISSVMRVSIAPPRAALYFMYLFPLNVSLSDSFCCSSIREDTNLPANHNMQGTKRTTRQYVESQLSLFRQMSPKRARDKMEYVIVVGTSGNVHRHKLK